MYLWVDFSNWIEYGWYVDRGGIFTGPRTLFNARSFSGEYSGPFGDGVGDNLKTLSLTDYRLLMWRNQADDRWHFIWRQPSTSTTDNHLSFTRASPFDMGDNFAAVGTHNQCDDGAGHWWNLWDLGTTNPTWTQWSRLHWTCDTLKHYGYQEIRDDGEFKSVAVPDFFVGPTYPECNPAP